MKTTAGWLVLVFALSSAGGTANAGIDISWDDCVGGSIPSSNKNFACSSLSPPQTYSLIFQFKTPVEVPNFIALTAFLDLTVASAPAPLAPFWHYESGGCNASGVELFDEIPHSCAVFCYGDPWADGAEGQDMITYVPDFQGSGRGRFILVVVRPSNDPSPLKAFVNYFAAELRFNNLNRNACLGCAQQVLLVCDQMILEKSDASTPVILSGPDKSSNCATINGAPPACGFNPALSPADTDPPCQPVPVTNSSWGLLKTLFR